MRDEQLIELVREYEVIYNNKSAEYRDTSLRHAAWEEIARRLGKSVEDCKESWNKLRNCYNNAMKRRQKKSGQYFAPWRFEEQMSFLKPYKESRQPTAEYLDVAFDESPSDEEEPSTEAVSYAEVLPSYTAIPATAKRKASTSKLSDVLDIIKTAQEMKQKKQDMDDIDHFFLSMSKVVKRLPKMDQIRIKMNLHKDVSEAEMKQIETENGLKSTNKKSFS